MDVINKIKKCICNILLFLVFFSVGVIIYILLCKVYLSYDYLWVKTDDSPTNEAVSSFVTGIFSSFALIAAFIAIYFQKKELNETRKELHEQKKELENQNRTLLEQKFEHSFSSLYVSYKQSLLSIESDDKSEPCSGISYLRKEIENIANSLNNFGDIKLNIKNNLIKFELIFSQFFYLVNFVNESTELNLAQKEIYFRRLSSISLYELIFVGLFCTDKNICDKQLINIIKEKGILKRLEDAMKDENIKNFSAVFELVTDYIKNPNSFTNNDW